MGRIDRGLLRAQLLLRLIVGLARGKAVFQELGLPIEIGGGLRQQGLRRQQDGLGGVEIGGLLARIEPRQDLIRLDMVADIGEPLLDSAAGAKRDVAGEFRLDAAGEDDLGRIHFVGHPRHLDQNAALAATRPRRCGRFGRHALDRGGDQGDDTETDDAA